jgi:hypothetical protein
MSLFSKRQTDVDIVFKEVLPDPKSTGNRLVLVKTKSEQKKRMQEMNIYYMLIALNEPASFVARCASSLDASQITTGTSEQRMSRRAGSTGGKRTLRSIAGSRKNWSLVHGWKMESRREEDQVDTVWLLQNV